MSSRARQRKMTVAAQQFLEILVYNDWHDTT